MILDRKPRGMTILRWILRGIGYRIVRIAEVGTSSATRTLRGDRDVECSWVAAHLPDNPGRVLDFGCSTSHLPLLESMKGGDVIGLDQLPVEVPFQSENVHYRQGDVLDFDFGDTKFDVIVSCSTIEHVGLAGRYGSKDAEDGDLVAMQRLRGLLAVPDGTMILTVPVGKDSVFPPLHRVYGQRRLKELLQGFEVIRQEFWSKNAGSNIWVQVSECEALKVEPSRSFYALGLMVLKRQSTNGPHKTLHKRARVGPWVCPSEAAGLCIPGPSILPRDTHRRP